MNPQNLLSSAGRRCSLASGPGLPTHGRLRMTPLTVTAMQATWSHCCPTMSARGGSFLQRILPRERLGIWTFGIAMQAGVVAILRSGYRESMMEGRLTSEISSAHPAVADEGATVYSLTTHNWPV
jgi:hypothetical protein